MADLTKVEKAFLDTIAFSEGMLGVSFNGYDVLGGYYQINGWEYNTNLIHGGNSWKQPQTPGKTVDVGRYQFNIDTWLDMNNGVNVPITANNQDYSALRLMNKRKPKGFINESITNKTKFDELVNALKKSTWYGLGQHSSATLFSIFNEALVKY